MEGRHLSRSMQWLCKCAVREDADLRHASLRGAAIGVGRLLHYLVFALAAMLKDSRSAAASAVRFEFCGLIPSQINGEFHASHSNIDASS